MKEREVMPARDEDRDEADRLKQLPRQLQREIVETIGSPADDPEVSAENRREARRRAKAGHKTRRGKPWNPVQVGRVLARNEAE
jgi:hypothetical protein